MSYKRNAASNRDALFGGSATTGGKSNSLTQKKTIVAVTPSIADTKSRKEIRSKTGNVAVLTGDAKRMKMKEAEEYRSKAKKSMTHSLFSKADSTAGAIFYHRAAEAYKMCGEHRLERLHRIASAECQMSQDAYALAANEYMRAAVLTQESTGEQQTLEQQRNDVSKLYGDASAAWRNMGEFGKAGECMLLASFGLLLGDDNDNDEYQDEFATQRTTKKAFMNRKALTAIEETIENYVPDILNRYASFRQTGTSAYKDTTGSANDELLLLARENMIKSSYAHEPLFQACFKLLQYKEYASALYASGAASAILEADEFVTISISRAYCTETIITLALGDVVAAEEYFTSVHLQRNSYLSSRECKLAEDLIRAINGRSVDALEAARDPSGENRAALSNLDASLRELVFDLRTSGVAKKQQQPDAVLTKNAAPPTAAANASSPSSLNADALADEMDHLMDDMGLGSDEEDDKDPSGSFVGGSHTQQQEDSDDDDDIDLR